VVKTASKNASHFGALQAGAGLKKIAVVGISQILNNSVSIRRVGVAVVSALVVVLCIVFGLQMRASVVLEKRQAALLDGIERRNPGRIQRLVAEDYTDRWGFSRKEIVTSLVDVGSQFLALVVKSGDGRLHIEDGTATYTTKLTIGGKPLGPAGQEAMRQLNQLEEPFVFTWEKKSFLPASWRLVRVENASLPDELYGYRPGDIGRAMRGE
jgi:hypothetical protein